MDGSRDGFQLYSAPELREPYLIAAWTGMGAVALLAANYLRQELKATMFGRIDPREFYAPTQATVAEGLVQPILLPETRLYHWQGGTRHDLVFLVGTEQPPNTYRLAVEAVRTAKQLGVQRVYTAAALPTAIHHAETPAVWGIATHPDQLIELGHFGVKVMAEGSVSGLNGLLLSVAKEHDVDGICLLGEIPLYTTQMVNPRASLAVLEVLAQMLELEVELGGLAGWADDLVEQMDRLYALLPEQLRGSFERGERSHAASRAESPRGERPLVADDAFFREIERFLERQRRRPGRDEPDESETAG